MALYAFSNNKLQKESNSKMMTAVTSNASTSILWQHFFTKHNLISIKNDLLMHVRWQLFSWLLLDVAAKIVIQIYFGFSVYYCFGNFNSETITQYYSLLSLKGHLQPFLEIKSIIVPSKLCCLQGLCSQFQPHSVGSNKKKPTLYFYDALLDQSTWTGKSEQ